MNDIVDEMSNEIRFMRMEIANEWHLKNISRLKDKHAIMSKSYFINLPIESRKNRLSEEILWGMYNAAERAEDKENT